MKGTQRRVLPLLLALVLSSCDTAPTPFDSSKWRNGGVSTRGGMTQDVMESELLVGKTAAEVEELLGRPDHRDARWFGYSVITIARCYVWKCEMQVVFDRPSGRVYSVAVSD